MKIQDKVALVSGAIIGGMVILVGLVALVYWLTIQVGETGVRVWATIATLALPVAVLITYRLATHAAREHLAGLNRGLEHSARTVETMGRSLSATASLARTTRSTGMMLDNKALLPEVATRPTVEHRQDNNGGTIDL
jgi:hypothetical protein